MFSMTGKKDIALETRAQEEARLFSPSAARNRDAIRDVYLSQMPLKGEVLEIGSGTGEHGVHIAAAAPNLRWLPGDPDAASRASIAAWTEHLRLTNVAPPHDADVAKQDWFESFPKVAGLVTINMIHIAPFAAAEGLFAGARRLLDRGGRLFLYGPFKRDGEHTAPSNAEFDASLRSRDPRWGVRDLDREIAPLAENAGFRQGAVIAMPANNFSAIFER
jgi:cyclopropane fatty-acyl-phospholipid synthase-like methyltransferase